MYCFFCNGPATTKIYTLSLHDALPISSERLSSASTRPGRMPASARARSRLRTELISTAASTPRPHTSPIAISHVCGRRSEEHTSELQSQFHLVCRLLLEKKKHNDIIMI